MKESKLFKSLVATFVVIVLGGPAVVLAGTPKYFEVKTTVSYTDLNLENEEAVRVLYRRLQRASKKVCGATSLNIARSSPVSLQRGTPKERRHCYQETLSNAIDKFDNGDLTRIHAR